MKWMLSIIIAVLIFMQANAYDGSFDDGLDSSWSYIDYSYQDETNLIGTSLYSSEEYYSYGSQPESIYVYDSEIPYEGGYSTPYQLWIVTNGEMTQYTQCPLYTQLRMIAYSPGGPGTMSEIYPDGRQTSNFYQFETGNTELTFVADKPGRHTVGYEINGQFSNVVIIDVVSYGGEEAGPSYPSEGNYPPVVNSLEYNPGKSGWLNQGHLGAPITFTADAYDQDGDQIFYRFWIAKDIFCLVDIIEWNGLDFNKYQPATDWTADNSFTWYPYESDFESGMGCCAIMVEVRDGFNEPPESWDDFAETTISVCRNDPSLCEEYYYADCGCPQWYSSQNTGDKPNRKASRPKSAATGSKSRN